MLVSGDKQNNNNCNHLANPSRNTQTYSSPLAKTNDDAPTSPQGSVSSEIAIKIEQERQNNLKLYQKIKSKFSCFEYTLRPAIYASDCNSMIREYGRLMTERQYLQKEATKLEYRFNLQSKNTAEPYQFLIQLWNVSKYSQSDGTSEDTIDRLNKALVRTRQSIGACLQTQEDNNVGEWTQFVLKSQPYQKILGQLDQVNTKLEELEIASLTKDAEQEEILKQSKEENANLRATISALNTKIDSLSANEIELYRKISTLTAELMKKQGQIDRLKTIQTNSKRYLTQNCSQGHCYEIIISQQKAKGRGYVRIDKTYEQITAYLETHKGTALQMLDLHSNSESDSHSQTSIPDQLSNKDELPPQCQSLKSSPYFSSARKPRRQFELHCFQTQQKSPINAVSVTEMRFVRRR